jgi:hemerythrin superfamily protein
MFKSNLANTSLIAKMTPTITNMIRMDHTHVMTAFHQYTLYRSPSKKQALANIICTGLEIHAQLEEEIFYPAMQLVKQGNEVLDKSVPEHDDMRRLIGKIRALSPESSAYDESVMQLMRMVIHHVADEAVLLPEAERLLGKNRLSELGVQMTKRRMQLVKPHAGELAVNHVRSLSTSTMMLLAGGAALALGIWTKRATAKGI